MSNVLKAGQKVRRTWPSHHGVTQGNHYTVSWAEGSGVTLEGLGNYTYDADRFEPVDATPAPLDPSADDALAASLQRLGKVWGEYREQQVRGAAKALDVVAASIQQVVDAANAAHQPAPEPEPEWKDGQIGDALVHGASVRGFISNDGESFVFSVPGGGYHEAGYGSFEDFVPLVVIDPAAVDVDALAEALRREWSGKDFDVTFSWSDIAKTVVSELGIEATS